MASLEGYLAGHPAGARLNLGCGGALLDGWLNVDLHPREGALALDVTEPFPLPDTRFDHVLAEHVIEHLPLVAGRAMLCECARVLRPGGRIRVSTPDLRFVAGLHDAGGDEAARRYVAWAAASFAAGADGTAAALAINNAFRNWGHQFLYDETTLRRALQAAGLGGVTRHRYRASDDPALDGVEGRGIDAVGIEMRTAETLALEAVRRGAGAVSRRSGASATAAADRRASAASPPRAAG